MEDDLKALREENAALKIELTELQARLLRSNAERLAPTFEAHVAKVMNQIHDAIEALKK